MSQLQQDITFKNHLYERRHFSRYQDDSVIMRERTISVVSNYSKMDKASFSHLLRVVLIGNLSAKFFANNFFGIIL